MGRRVPKNAYELSKSGKREHDGDQVSWRATPSITRYGNPVTYC